MSRKQYLIIEVTYDDEAHHGNPGEWELDKLILKSTPAESVKVMRSSRSLHARKHSEHKELMAQIAHE